MPSDAVSPRDWREARRQRAFELQQMGWKPCRIAEALGGSKAAISQWLCRKKRQGPNAWRTQPRSGRPPKLTQQQLEMIPDMLSQGAEAWGFRGELWTCRRVATILRWQFKVSYHRGHVARLLQHLQWSPQIPIQRAVQ